MRLAYGISGMAPIMVLPRDVRWEYVELEPPPAEAIREWDDVLWTWYAVMRFEAVQEMWS